MAMNVLSQSLICKPCLTKATDNQSAILFLIKSTVLPRGSVTRVDLGDFRCHNPCLRRTTCLECTNLRQQLTKTLSTDSHFQTQQRQVGSRNVAFSRILWQLRHLVAKLKSWFKLQQRNRRNLTRNQRKTSKGLKNTTTSQCLL